MRGTRNTKHCLQTAKGLIFISSVQKELAEARRTLKNYIQGDALLGRFFDGELPPSLTPESLRRPHASIPRNPLLAEPLFLTRHIEKAGTGILDMIGLCKDAKLRPPEFRQEMGQFIQTLWRPRVSTEIPLDSPSGTKSALSRHQVEILRKCRSDSTLVVLMTSAGRSDRTKFRHQVLSPLMERGLIEMTIPDKPRSRLQKYRLTAKARALLAAADKDTGKKDR